MDDAPLTGRAVLGAQCAIFDRELRVLLVRHSYGRLNWELPGGFALPGEDPSSTARRELFEETGLDLSPIRLTGVYYEAVHDFGPLLSLVFLFPWEETLTPVAKPPEITDVQFWPLEKLPRPLSDFTYRRILDASGTEVRFALIDGREWLP